MLAQETKVITSKRRRAAVTGLWPKLRGLQISLLRHLLAHNTRPYQQILYYIRSRPDIWIASQGEYIDWWQRREKASLKITVADGLCRVETSLNEAVIEQFPGQFLDSTSVACAGAKFSGEVWLTIDSTLEKKELLIELLKREGIMNFRVAATGEFVLGQADVGVLLEEIETKLSQRGCLFEADVVAVRQLVLDKLAAYNLPLLRIWYHPRLNGVIPKAVFSVRYDVDRAITNMSQIRALELKYNAPSTLYLRTFCPFYGDQEIRHLASQPWCSEITVHGEFVTNARHYGDEFKAARAEKNHLEKLIGRPILGVSMHGGELAYNRSDNTAQAIEEAGFLYDTTPTFFYYFPYRAIVNGQLSQSYTLCHTLSDVRMPPGWNYGRVFYEQAVARMNKIYEQHGVFVLLLHPIYFGLFSYLSQPKNLYRLIKFMIQLFKKPAF